MPKLTWLGDAECIWNNVTFPPGVPVDIDDPYMIGKARHSPFFKVEIEVSFFDDPPDEPQSVFGPSNIVPTWTIGPETWTNDPEPEPLKRRRGRPPKHVPAKAGGGKGT